MIYSFIATCKAAGIEPREWFEDVIRRIPEYENGRSDVTHLLPKNWKRDFNKVTPTLINFIRVGITL